MGNCALYTWLLDFSKYLKTPDSMATEWRLGQGTLCQSRRPHLGARYWQGLSFPAGQIVSEEVPLETSGVVL